MELLKSFGAQKGAEASVSTLFHALQPACAQMVELKDRWLGASGWHLDYEAEIQRLMQLAAGAAHTQDVFEQPPSASGGLGLTLAAADAGMTGFSTIVPLISPPQSEGSLGRLDNTPVLGGATLPTPPQSYGQSLGLTIPETAGQVKFKWGPFMGPQTAPHSWRFSTLITPAQRFTLTQTFDMGRFGKVRWCVDPQGEVLVAKEFRLGATADEVVPNKKTKTRSISHVAGERNRTVFFRSVLDLEVAPIQGLLSDRAALNLFRTGTQPLRVVDAVVSHHSRKGYLVMTRETGDLYHLQRILQHRPELCAAAARSMATQIFVELQAMHEKCLHGHFDLNRGNILFNRMGQFKLKDFDAAVPMHDGTTPVQSGERGTLAALDRGALSPGSPATPSSGAAADIFALAALTVHLAHPDPSLSNPFEVLDADQDLSREERMRKAWTQMLQFEAWKNALRPSPSEPVDVSKIQPHGLSVFDAFFAPLAQRAPFLCDRLINRAMVEDVTQRASARELATGFLRNTLEVDTTMTACLVAKMAEADDLLDMEHLSRQALHYDAWQQCHVASIIAQSPQDGTEALALNE
jgi:hypothetical protein